MLTANGLSSASSSFINPKSAPPTPTIMIESGSGLALTIARIVDSMSDIAPSNNYLFLWSLDGLIGE